MLAAYTVTFIPVCGWLPCQAGGVEKKEEEGDDECSICFEPMGSKTYASGAALARHHVLSVDLL